MSHSKHGRRALVLVIFVALGLMAFAAASAQALTGWLLNGAFLTANKSFAAKIHPLAGGKVHGSLLTTIGTTNTPIEILCEGLTVTGGTLIANEKDEGSGELNFSNCATFLNKGTIASASCKPQEPIVASVKFHAILHTSKEEADKGDGKTYLLFEPTVKGGTIAIIKLGPPVVSDCVVGTEMLISGEFVTECLNEKLEKNTINTDYCFESMTNHLIQEVAKRKLFLLEGTLPKEEKYDELKFGTRAVTLDGIASASDVGGGTFGVHV